MLSLVDEKTGLTAKPSLMDWDRMCSDVLERWRLPNILNYIGQDQLTRFIVSQILLAAVKLGIDQKMIGILSYDKRMEMILYLYFQLETQTLSLSTVEFTDVTQRYAIGVGPMEENQRPTLSHQRLLRDQVIFGTESETKMEGRKHDNDKPRFDLLPPTALREVAEVFSGGARKYDDRNWEMGIKYGRVFGAAQRHLWAWMGGEDKDPEWGLSHLAHAAAGLLFLLHYEHQSEEFKAKWDDRPTTANAKVVEA